MITILLGMLAIMRAQIAKKSGITMDEIKPFEARYKRQKAKLNLGEPWHQHIAKRL